jgi:sugar phosphate isomerase/epimerase
MGACADTTEANNYIDTLNEMAGEKCFGFCLDVGHLLILSIDPCYAIEAIGDRLEVLHIHDNDGYLDDHTQPFLGVCNWNRFIKGLKAIGYRGNINLEASSFVQLFPNELAPAALGLLAATAKYFKNKLLAE